MTKQVSIRSERAHELAIKLSKRHGKTITQLIEDALADVDARDEAAVEERRKRWMTAIVPVQRAVREQGVTFEVEDMYDNDGLPC
jgi:hypothetical protein